jgi:hypothetical protein
MENHLNSYQKFEQLRQKLINGETLNAAEATGDTIAKMLREVTQMDSLEESYCLPTTQLEQHIIRLTQRMKDIKASIEAMWKSSIHFKDTTVAAADLTGLSSIITTVLFVNCQSEEWVEVG